MVALSKSFREMSQVTIGKAAPDFTAKAVINGEITDYTLSANKGTIVHAYPLIISIGTHPRGPRKVHCCFLLSQGFHLCLPH